MRAHRLSWPFHVATTCVVLGMLVTASGCEDPPCCTSDVDCPSYAVCNEVGACALTCTSSSDCGDDELCVRTPGGRSDQGVCTRADGSPVDGDGQCLMPDEPVEPDAGVSPDGGSPIDGGNAPDAGPTCVEDAFEPNSASTPPAPVEVDVFRATLCDGDDDHYRLPTPAGPVQVSLRVLRGDSELRFIIANVVNGEVLFADETVDGLWVSPPFTSVVPGEDTLMVTSSSDVEYLVTLRALDPQDGGVVVDGGPTDGGIVTPDGGVDGGEPIDGGGPDPDGGAACEDDAFEPNDTAAEAAAHDGRPAGRLCPNDDDHYAIDLEAGATLTARLSAMGVPMELLGPLPSQTARAFSSTGDLVYRANGVAGTFALRVIASDVERVYALDIDVTPPMLVDGGIIPDGGVVVDGGVVTDGGIVIECVDDGLEPNDTPLQATDIDLAGAAVMCPGNADFYTTSLAVGDRWTVEERTNSPVELLLLGPAPDFVVVAQGIGGVSTTASRDGDHFLMVRPLSDNRNLYAVRSEVERAGEPDAGVGCTDAFEPNDEVPVPFPLGEAQEAEICEDDVDRFWVEVPFDNANVQVTLQFEHSFGDLDMHLRNRNFDIIATSQSVSNEELFDELVTRGEYIVEVYGFSGATGPYELSIDVEETFVCLNDNFESNNTVQDAAAIGDGTLDGVLCSGDRDFYRLDDVAIGADVVVEMTYDAPPGVDLRVLQAGVGVVATSTNGNGFEEVSFVNQNNGAIFVRITGSASGEGQPYSLFVDTGGSGCVEDGFEPNDNPLQATPLMMPFSIEGTLCQAGAVDIYRTTPIAPTLFINFTADDPMAQLAILRVDTFEVIATLSAAIGDTVVDVDLGVDLGMVVTGSSNASYQLTVSP